MPTLLTITTRRYTTTLLHYGYLLFAIITLILLYMLLHYINLLYITYATSTLQIQHYMAMYGPNIIHHRNIASYASMIMMADMSLC